MLLGPAEALQLYQAASQLGTDLVFSGPSASAKTARSLGAFAPHVIFNAGLPPATASQQRWPVLADVVRDLGKAGLAKETILAGPMRSWLATYALVTIVQQFGHPDDVSASAVTAALKAAKDVDMQGLIPAWTPSAKASTVPAYSAISQPWNYLYSYDAGGKVKVADKLVNVTQESTGHVDYPQPADAG